MRNKNSDQGKLPSLIRKCWMRLNGVFHKRVSEVGLTPDQYIALRWLNERTPGTVCQATLKTLMFTDPNNIAALVRRMERLNLISRQRDPADGRRKLVYCTAKGKSLYERAKVMASGLEEEVLSALGKDERKEFTGLLREINRHLHRDRPAG